MMKKLVLLTLLVASLFAEVDLTKAMLYKADIDSKTAYKMQQEGVLLVDVRTKREFKFLRAKNSLNIPIFFEKYGQRVLNKNFLNQIDYALGSDSDKAVILICRSGSRTKFASNILAQNGFTNVYNIKKGFSYDWKKVGLPTER